ncbi:MAG TPA: energy transducer TonB [Terriglobales bacterium]|nr:energy transducer TonB [Terriglobales bacterium]
MGFFGEQDRREWITLAGTQGGRHRRRISSLACSALAHAALLAALAWPVAPLFITPRPVARGQGGNAGAVASVTLLAPPDLNARTVGRTAQLVLPKPAEDHAGGRLQKRTNALDVKDPSGTREPGSPYGTSYYGLSYGEEIKPALPVVFPDLRIARDQLPDGVHGDVIVEVTIDEHGSVIEQRLLQGIGYGIDERVLALLRDWRFRPATRNGVPIASKHDVHFHFPS